MYVRGVERILLKYHPMFEVIVGRTGKQEENHEKVPPSPPSPTRRRTVHRERHHPRERQKQTTQAVA